MNEVPVGSALDALVAEYIMGFHRIPGFKYDRLGPIENPTDILMPPHMTLDHAMDYIYTRARGVVPLTHMVPSYSTLLEKGWMVLEKMQGKGFCFRIWETASESGTYAASFESYATASSLGVGKSVAEAICRAALNAIDPTILNPCPVGDR